MRAQQKKSNLLFRPAGIVILLVIVFVVCVAVVIAVNYSEEKQLAAAADKIQQGMSRLKSLANAGQMINNRVPRSYNLTLRDCQKDCFYELGASTAEGQEVVLEKVFLSGIYLKLLRPTGGVLRLSLAAGEDDLSAASVSLIEIGSLLVRRSLTASLSTAGHLEPADFKPFQQKLPEAYLPWLPLGSSANIEIATATNSGVPKSVGIYWQKDGSFSQLSVKLSQAGSKEQKILRSEIRNFDSQLATLCFDLPSSQAVIYLVALEPQGTAAEGAKNISLRVFKEYDCQGDNLAAGVGKVEIIKNK